MKVKFVSCPFLHLIGVTVRQKEAEKENKVGPSKKTKKTTTRISVIRLVGVNCQCGVWLVNRRLSIVVAKRPNTQKVNDAEPSLATYRNVILAHSFSLSLPLSAADCTADRVVCDG